MGVRVEDQGLGCCCFVGFGGAVFGVVKATARIAVSGSHLLKLNNMRRQVGILGMAATSSIEALGCWGRFLGFHCLQALQQ